MAKNRIRGVCIAALALAAVACGGREAPTPGTADGPVAAAGSGENLGQKIGSSYVETLRQIVAMLNDKPAPADAKAMLADMKNWTIELMVDLGMEREALLPAEREKADRVLSQRIAAVPGDLFAEYQQRQAFYKDDRELFNLIADFNVISQYANFDLRKKQLPEEAKRLGIE